ncbi:MAG: spermidine/putrescine ABC transporter substrate-binding protein [Clostridiaceae bacterium]
MFKKLSIVLALLFTISVPLAGCGKKEELAKEINVYNWSEYLPQSVIDKFQAETGIKVNYETYDSNEQMLAKISAGNSGYDIAVASDYMVDVMIKQNLLQEFDLNNVPNFKNIGDEYKKASYDPENKYSVAYMVGSAIIAVNKDKVTKKITSVADLWDPSLKNSLVVLDDERAIIGLALKKLGYSLNETDPAKLEQAKKELIKLKPNIKAFDSASPKKLLISGEATVGYVWNAEVALAKKDNPSIEAVYPKEGVYLWQDNFILPKGGEHKKEAEMFINFLLRDDVSKMISDEFPYTNPNAAARKLMDKSVTDNTIVYPTSDLVKNGEHLKDLGDTTQLYDKIWTEFKQQ